MRQRLIGAACTLLLSSSQPALAIDFHPLESLTLPGGVYEYDSIIIPEGVTVTLVGEPRELRLSTAGPLRIDGDLVGPGWSITMEAGDQLVINGTLRADSGNLTLIGRAPPLSIQPGPANGMLVQAGAILCLAPSCGNDPGNGILSRSDLVPGLRLGGDIVLSAGSGALSPGAGQLVIAVDSHPLNGNHDRIVLTSFITPSVPEPEIWVLLLAGLGLVGWVARPRPA